MKHEKITVRRRGSKSEAHPVSEAKEASWEAEAETFHPPFPKKVPSGHYHHHRGGRWDQDTDVRELSVKEEKPPISGSRAG